MAWLQVQAAVSADTGAPLQITSAADLAQLTDGMGLPLSVAEPAAAQPAPIPWLAPFSALAPQLLDLARRSAVSCWWCHRVLIFCRMPTCLCRLAADDCCDTVLSQASDLLDHLGYEAVTG